MPSKETPQVAEWNGSFGKNYTERNLFTPAEHDALYVNDFGVSRKALNEEFLATVPKNASILEVGCNIGNQLLLLQEMGFSNLSGIELQSHALEIARSRTRDIALRQGSAFDLPFKDRQFDLVFTSRVLIHIAPDDLSKATSEIHRCAGSYIWGLEYFSPSVTEVEYRGHVQLLWKMNYAEHYLRNHRDLELIKERKLSYLQSDNADSMFVLRRARG